MYENLQSRPNPFCFQDLCSFEEDEDYHDDIKILFILNDLK